MPTSQHHKLFTRLNSGGVNRDHDHEQLGASEVPDYVDSLNGRTTSLNGSEAGAWKKINGEEIIYPNTDNRCDIGTGAPLNNYKCLYSEHFFLETDHIVEIWADKNKQNPSLLRIDGVIVLYSSSFPISVDFPPQARINESCIGGEFYITDFHTPPIIFNLKDLMVNGGMLPDDEGNTICTDKYFGAFNINEYVIELNLPNNHPIFIQIAKISQAPIINNPSGRSYIFSGAGFIVGTYQYSIRYSSVNGDKTKFTVATPLIPIVRNLSNSSYNSYPFTSTFGNASPLVSEYGIHIRFRVTNLLNYDFVEIKRTFYALNQPLGTPGIEELLTNKIDIDEGEISIVNVFDENSPAEIITEAEAESQFTSIEAAKTLRYFDNRLFLFNIKYKSRDIDITLGNSINNERGYPVIKKLGKAGYDDPYNFAYFKKYMTGEKYGFAFAGFDGLGEKSFAVPLSGFTNYQFPDRRDILSPDSLINSQSVRAANKIASVSQTHEVFDLINAVQKSDKCTFKNIMQAGSNCAQAAGKSYAKITSGELSTCTNNPTNHFPCSPSVWTSDIGYAPYHPVNQNENINNNVQGHDFRVNMNVKTKTQGVISYNPVGFAPNYYSMGLGIEKITNIPSHIQSFSILRSKPANRVVAQGIGFYSMISAEDAPDGLLRKNLNEIWFFSQDVQDGLVDMTNIINNPSRYRFQFVSPLGFFSEVYDGNRASSSTRVQGIDFIVYARMLRDKTDNLAQINPWESNDMGITDIFPPNNDPSNHYTGFGHWRFPHSGGVFPGGFVAQDQFTINTITTINEGRGVYYKVKFNESPFYIYSAGTGQHDFDDQGVKDFHEPVYIVNIIDTSASVVSSNIDEYLETGHFQKVNAIIGKSNGSNDQNYLLVDERIEDCISQNANDDKIIFVKNPDLTSDRAWLDITNKVNPNQIIADINAGIKTVNFNGDTVKIYGVYKSSVNTPSFASALNPDTLYREASVIFSSSYNPGGYNNDLFVPNEGALIKVKYDTSSPIMVYGGDTIVGEQIFSPLDKLYVNDGTPSGGYGGVNDWRTSFGFPYRRYDINERVFLIDRTWNANKIADSNTIAFRGQELSTGEQGKVRQMCVMFTGESRINTPYAFNLEPDAISHDRYFPLVHYIMRPHKWEPNDTLADNNIYATYETDYPGEMTAWGYGGFRFLPQTNIDYSQDEETFKHSTKPKVGFKEKLLFCSRGIWSDIRSNNLIDDSGVRNFNPLNFYDFSDDTGEIKFAWDAMTGKSGSNIYVFTENGICLAITNKREIHELSGGQLATIGSDDTSVILGQVWLSKKIGMNDEMWRSKAEWNNLLFFTNKQSSYLFDGRDAFDMLKEWKYFSKVNKQYLSHLRNGYFDDMAGVYDTEHDEYWFHLDQTRREFAFDNTIELNSLNPSLDEDEVINVECTGVSGFIILPNPISFAVGNSFYVCNESAIDIWVLNFIGASMGQTLGNKCYKITHTYYDPIFNFDTWTIVEVATVPSEKTATFAVAPIKKKWMGIYDYRFDKFVSFKNRTFGSRNLETYELNKGFLINNSSYPDVFTSIKGKLIQAFNPDLLNGKEHIRIKVNSLNKPRRIKFFYDLDSVDNDNPISQIDGTTTYGLRTRDGYENYIPRETVSNKRVQSRLLYVSVEHDIQEDFKIHSISELYKKLK